MPLAMLKDWSRCFRKLLNSEINNKKAEIRKACLFGVFLIPASFSCLEHRVADAAIRHLYVYHRTYSGCDVRNISFGV